MKVRFCGADRQVTGSAHLLILDDGTKILLDCGLYQGSDRDMDDFNTSWLFKPTEIDLVILSHAHIDHSGRLPKLIKDGYEGNIISTHATRSLCSFMLLDCAYILKKDAEYQNRKAKGNKEITPLYDELDVADTMTRFITYPYEKWLPVRPNVEVLFRDAGHILGSASVTLRIKEKGKEIVFGFSGDVGRPFRPILRDPRPMPELDYLICESTYGDRDHESKPSEEEKFLQIIEETCLENKGKLIIPAFSVGRTQEIVYLLDQMETNGILPRIPVFVDSPMAINATQVFASHPECYDQELQEYLLVDDNPFGFNTLSYVRKVENSKALNRRKGPCIIISSSGMMNAGRVRHHLANNIEDPKNTFLIVGYCTPDTPGGMLLNGIKKIKLFGEIKQVKAKIIRMESFSAHADRMELLEFLKNQKKLQDLFLVHGEYETQLNFQSLLNQYHFNQVTIPKLGDEITIT